MNRNIPSSGRAQVDDNEAREVFANRWRKAELAIRRGRKLSGADLKIVQENIKKILDDAKSRGISRASICAKVEILPKHLNVYLPPKESSSRDRVHKTLDGYVKIAKATALLTKRDEKETLVTLLNGTDLLAEFPSEKVEDEYAELASSLKRICQDIIERHNLKSYFKDVQRIAPALTVVKATNPDNDECENDHDLMLEFSSHRVALQPWPVALEERSDDRDLYDDQALVPPYPTVVLGEVSCDEQVKIHVVASDTEDGPVSYRGTTTATYSVELRLCIVPCNTACDPEPALRVTTNAFIRRVPSTKPTIDDPFPPDLISFGDAWLIPCDRMALVDGKWGETGQPIHHLLVRGDLETVPAVLRKYFGFSDVPPHEYCKFFPLRPPVCQDWFGISVRLGSDWWPDEKPPHIRVLGPPMLSTFGLEYAGTSQFPANTVAAAVARSLWQMQGPNLAAMLECSTSELLQAWETFMEGLRRQEKRGRDALNRRLPPKSDANS